MDRAKKVTVNRRTRDGTMSVAVTHWVPRKKHHTFLNFLHKVAKLVSRYGDHPRVSPKLREQLLTASFAVVFDYAQRYPSIARFAYTNATPEYLASRVIRRTMGRIAR
jgi:hypothetical protein